MRFIKRFTKRFEVLWVLTFVILFILQHTLLKSYFWKYEKSISTLAIFITAAFGFTTIGLAKKSFFKSRWVLLVLFSMILGLLYSAGTSPGERENDAYEHMVYVKYIETHLVPPPLQLSGEAYHPPLYYYIAAGWDSLLTKTPLGESSWVNLQILGLLFFLTTLMISLFALKEIETQFGDLHWIGLVLFMIIPSHLYFASKINNDGLLPLFGVLSFWISILYFKKPSFKLAALGSLVCLASFYTKFSGIALCASFFLGSLLAPNFKNRKKDTLLIGVSTTLGLGAWLINCYIQTGQFIYSNLNSVPVNDPQYVANSFSKFLVVDVKAMMVEPFENALGGRIRNTLWTNIIVTALQGPGINQVAPHLLQLLHLIFFALLVIFAYGLFLKKDPQKIPLMKMAFAYISVTIVFLILLNYRQPESCTEDSRYLAPVFFCIAILFSLGFESALKIKTKALSWIFLALAVLCPTLILIFYGQLLYS